MIKKFKLFLENLKEDGSVVAISEEEWYDARDNNQIEITEDFFPVFSKFFNPNKIFQFDYDGDTEYDVCGDSNFGDTIYIFIDDDYWLYVNYGLPIYTTEIDSDGNYRSVHANSDEMIYLFYKIDIADGYDYVSEYWDIIEKIRNENE